MRVAVTGFISGDSPQPGVNVARSLKSATNGQVTIIALDSFPLTPSLGLHTWVDEIYIMPPPHLGPDVMLDFMQKLIHERTLDLLIPNNDAEVEIFALLKEDLHRLGLDLVLPPYETVSKRAKVNFHLFAQKLGYAVPETQVLRAPDDLWKANQFGYPVVLKGAYSDVYLARCFDDVLAYFSRLADRYGMPVLCQQFIEGDEYSIVAVADWQSDVVGAVAIRKLGITEKGKTWAAVTVEAPILMGMMANLVKDLGWIGPVEVELIRAEKTGEFFIIEVNPRFPAWVYLSVVAGQNLPLTVVELAGKRSVAQLPPYRPGVMFIRAFLEAIFTVDDLGALLVTSEESVLERWTQSTAPELKA